MKRYGHAPCKACLVTTSHSLPDRAGRAEWGRRSKPGKDKDREPSGEDDPSLGRTRTVSLVGKTIQAWEGQGQGA